MSSKSARRRAIQAARKRDKKKQREWKRNPLILPVGSPEYTVAKQRNENPVIGYVTAGFTPEELALIVARLRADYFKSVGCADPLRPRQTPPAKKNRHKKQKGPKSKPPRPPRPPKKKKLKIYRSKVELIEIGNEL